MTIYILSEIHAETAQMLDDKMLDRQIKEIAQTLCNVFWYDFYHEGTDSYVCKNNLTILLEFNKLKSDAFILWASQCRANYLWLVEMAVACCKEWFYRFADFRVEAHPFDTLERIIKRYNQNIYSAFKEVKHDFKIKSVG